MGWGNDAPRVKEQQPSKADRHRRKHPLTVQPSKPSVPAPLLHQGVLLGSSFECSAPKLSPVPKRTRKSTSMHPNAFGHLGDQVKATQQLLMEQRAQPSARTDPSTLPFQQEHLSLAMQWGRSPFSLSQNTLRGWSML